MQARLLHHRNGDEHGEHVVKPSSSGLYRRPHWLAMPGDGSGDSARGRQPSPPSEATDAELLDASSRAVISVVDAIGPAVVAVARRRGQESGGVGSGVFITADGFAL